MTEISSEHMKRMRKLAKEGKLISKIVQEDFPNLSYWDVYIAVYSGGERSSTGIKRMITNRINDITNSTSKTERGRIANELHNLVWHLYKNHRANLLKLTQIREALDE